MRESNMALHSSRREFITASAALPVLAVQGRAADIFVPHRPPESALSPPNEKIQRDRSIGLSVLKADARQIEHGMRLHAECLVCEPYGFSPRFAVDGAAFQAAVQAGASNQELQDLREEMFMTRGATNARERAEYLEAFRASGVTCVFQNAGEEGNDPLRLIKRLSRFTFLTDAMRDDLFKAVRPDDIVEAKKQQKLCLYIATNGVSLPQRWDTVRDELACIRLFFQLGVRAMHLTYNRRNPLGDGSGERSNGGLSDFGRAAIAEMNRIGVIVDVAHSGWRTSLEAAKASAKPMMASHTTCAAVYEHIRSKPDEVLKAICDSGGLFGICVLPRFLGGTGDIRAFLDHLDYAIRHFGAEHVAISTDTAYISRHEETERAKVAIRPGGGSPLSLPGSRWEHLWPAERFSEGPPPKLDVAPLAAQTTAWTNWPLFTVGMIQRGHSDDTIRKVLGENVLRVARANFPASII